MLWNQLYLGVDFVIPNIITVLLTNSHTALLHIAQPIIVKIIESTVVKISQLCRVTVWRTRKLGLRQFTRFNVDIFAVEKVLFPARSVQQTTVFLWFRPHGLKLMYVFPAIKHIRCFFFSCRCACLVNLCIWKMLHLRWRCITAPFQTQRQQKWLHEV